MWALLKSPLIMGHDLLAMVRLVSEAKQMTRGIDLRYMPPVQRNLDDPYKYGNHCDKPGSKWAVRDTTIEETTSRGW